MVGLAYRLRIMGSLALSLCHLAAGRVDAVCSLKGARSVDIAAAQLLVRERGLAIDLPEAPPFGAAPLDIEGRSRCRRGAQRRRSASACSPRCRREAGPHRLLGLELRALARRRLLPAAAAAAALARVLRAALRHGRDQRDLLPPAARDRRSCELGARVAAGIRLRGEDEPLPRPTSSGCATCRRASSSSTSGSARSPSRRSSGPLLWQLPPTSSATTSGSPRRSSTLPPGRHCLSSAHDSWFVEPVYELLRAHGVALVIGDTPEVATTRRTS